MEARLGHCQVCVEDRLERNFPVVCDRVTDELVETAWCGDEYEVFALALDSVELDSRYRRLSTLSYVEDLWEEAATVSF